MSDKEILTEAEGEAFPVATGSQFPVPSLLPTPIDRILFVYSKNGVVACRSANEIRGKEQQVKDLGWHHTATIDPARWSEHLANDLADPSDKLDEIQFSANAHVQTSPTDSDQ